MNKKHGIISVIAAFVLCLQMVPMSVFSTEDYRSDAKIDNVFFLDSENVSFTLLSGDAKAGYYVLANDYYGTHAYAESSGTGFSLTDSESIGYWLNNGYITEDNTLPKQILGYIDYDHIWDEGKAGISLLSKSDINEYKDKIGFTASFNHTEYTQNEWWYLRDINTENPSRPYVAVGGSEVPGIKTVLGTTKNLVRPVFYLKPEFFENVKIDVFKTGKAIKRVIADNGKLNVNYSEAERAILNDSTANFYVSMSARIMPDTSVPTELYFDIIVNADVPVNDGFSIIVTAPGMDAVNKNLNFRDGNTQNVKIYLKNFNRKTVYTARLYYKACLIESTDISAVGLDDVLNDGYIYKGFNTHIEQSTYNIAETLNLLDRVGATVVRDHTTWVSVEKEKDKYVFGDKFSEYVEKLYRNGIEMIAVLVDNNPLYGDAYDGVIDTPEEIDGFVNYALAHAKRFPQIKRYEILNEKDGVYTPEQYATLCAAVGKALKEYNPEIKITAGALSTIDGWKTFASKMIDENSYMYVDAISCHLYHVYYTGDSDLFHTDSEFVRTCGREFGGWFDIQITETGYSIKDGWEYAVDKDVQALEMLKRAVTCDAVGMRLVTNYVLKEKGNEKEAYQFVEKDGELLPSYLVMREYINRVKYAKFMGEVQIADNVYAYWYKDKDRDMVVMWQKPDGGWMVHTNSKAVTVSLESSANVYDMYGEKINNTGSVSLQTYPVWVDNLREDYLKNAYAETAEKRIENYKAYLNDSTVNEFASRFVSLSRNPTAECIESLLNDIYDYGKTMIKRGSGSTKELSSKLYELNNIASEVSKLSLLCTDVPANSKINKTRMLYNSFETAVSKLSDTERRYKDGSYREGKKIFEYINCFKNRRDFGSSSSENIDVSKDGLITVKGTAKPVFNVSVKIEDQDGIISYLGYAKADELGNYEIKTRLEKLGIYTVTINDCAEKKINLNYKYDDAASDEEKIIFGKNIQAVGLLEWSQALLSIEIKDDFLFLEKTSFENNGNVIEYSFSYDNTYASTNKPVMFVAAYNNDDDVLTDCSMHVIENGMNNLSGTLKSGGDNMKVKVMLWGNTDCMKPLKREFSMLLNAEN